MNVALRWLSEEARHQVGLHFFRVALGLMLVFRVGTELPFRSYLWGPHGIATGSARGEFGPWLGSLLDLPFRSEVGVLIVLLLLAGSGVLLIVGIASRLATILALVTFTTLELRLTEVTDGGDNIARLCLLYLAFTLPRGVTAKPGSLSVWVHNVAVLAIAAQASLLYFTAGFYKAGGEVWQRGTAMYYISQVDWFSLPALRPLFSNPLGTTLASYGPMVYQLLFPMAMLSVVKLPWLAMGIAFHVGIAAFMGLITFSCVMIGLELSLISDGEYRKLRSGMSRAWLRLRQGLAAVGRATEILLRRRGLRSRPWLTVYYDGWCSYCRQTVYLTSRLDLMGRCEFVSFRDGLDGLPNAPEPGAFERRMQVLDHASGAWSDGYVGLRSLTGHILLLRPLLPVLMLAGWLGIGDRIYDWVAARRVIVPDSRGCDSLCGPERSPKSQSLQR